MRDQKSIKQLYQLALAEGEGVGTAYEYYAKRLRLLPWLDKSSRPKTMLIAGLPQKYGASLDFLLLGAEIGCQITVVDDRLQALQRLSSALEMLAEEGFEPVEAPLLLQTGYLSRLDELHREFDLAISSEVLQRLDLQARARYVGRLFELAPRVALFAPNVENKAHVGLSGLDGLYIDDLRELAESARSQGSLSSMGSCGFIDMPPFPPGITRSDAQREEATSGKKEAVAMRGLEYYAHAERFVPQALSRRWSHIVYYLSAPHPR